MTDEADPLARIREAEADVEALADRDDTLGATAQCLLKWAHDEQPLKTTVEQSHLPLDVDTGTGPGFEDILTSTPAYTGPTPSDDTLVSAVDRVLENTPERKE